MAIPGTTITDVSAGAAQAIGRYFSVISVVPSSLFVTFSYLLIASGSWTQRPDWQRAISDLEHPGISGLALLAFLSIALGIIIHPIQFSIVQFLEGYWGASKLALAVRAQRTLHYQKKLERLELRKTTFADAHGEPDPEDFEDGGQPEPAEPAPPATVLEQAEYAEAMRLTDTYFPPFSQQIMPTRLGNMLRRAEVTAGSQYKLDALQATPHLMMIAPESQVSYVNDQRTLLDLAVRMTFLSAAATAMALLFLWPYPKWALIALFPYAATYLSYRGAIVAARHYGSAISLLINLNRFRLYEALHVALPTTTDAERAQNRQLTNMFRPDSGESVSMPYEHPLVSDAHSAQAWTAPGGAVS